MHREITIQSWNELMDALYENDLNPEINRHRNGLVYRGLQDASFELTSSLQRHRSQGLEWHLLRNFQKYAQLDKPPTSDWLWLALAQHHGLPTRLLDWSYSPLISLHFATADYSKFDTDCAVWAVNFWQLQDHLPQAVQEEMQREGNSILTTEILERVSSSVEKYYGLSDKPFISFFEPPSLDGRIINQYAVFSFISDPTVSVESWLKSVQADSTKIIIPKHLLWMIRDRLDKSNITERMLFPGLDGLAQWLKRYYYDASQD
ncbi:MAG: FRG domain-containing protein [Pseudomonadota bacterium]